MLLKTTRSRPLLYLGRLRLWIAFADNYKLRRPKFACVHRTQKPPVAAKPGSRVRRSQTMPPMEPQRSFFSLSRPREISQGRGGTHPYRVKFPGEEVAEADSGTV